jgi:5-methylthioadenosine/S-adenosylhomocysteine deaminase
MSILIKNVLLDGKKKDVFIEGNIIKEIGENIDCECDETIDGQGKAIIPSFVNAHTHAAMTLMRGYADDMQVMQWLEEKIWPLEGKLTEDDVYWGTKLACLEMIKSGTTFFNDMYWHYHGTARAVEEMGIRAAVSAVFIDLFDENKAKEQIEHNKKLFEETKKYSDRIIFALGPHAIYTVSKESLIWAKKFADENGLLIHIHLSESKNEVDECIKKNSKRPVEYLDEIGFLGKNVITSHSIWLDDNEIDILAKNKVKVVHNPVSNMKLSSGVFPYNKISEKLGKSNIALGTDGCASNNNLDMFEEMKFAALLQKLETNDPSSMPAQEAFDMATVNGAKVFNLDCGEIKEGKLADLLLIDLKNIGLLPRHNLISNLVYSANGSCVDTTICNGKILMQNRKVVGEEEILEKANEIAMKLTK